VSIIQTYVAPKSGDKKKKNRTKNGPKISHIDPSRVPAAIVDGTRMRMNLAPIDPTNNPFAAVAIKRNSRSGYVTIPRNRTVARLGAFLLRNVITCAYCWRQGDLLLGPDGAPWGIHNGKAAGIDHVIPLCKGGIDNLSNMVKCCQACNSLKRQQHTWVPHPEAAWAAADPEVGLELWLNSDQIYLGTLEVKPHTIEIATQEELNTLTAQWLLTRPI
jgi:hypothetical protein